jgi:hypothetical protein
MSTTPVTSSPVSPSAAPTSFAVDLSNFKSSVNVDVLWNKFENTVQTWGENNKGIQTEAKMWQIRNENIAKVNESLEQSKSMLGDVTVQIPTTGDGKEIPGWGKMTPDQQKDIWTKAINGDGGYKLEQVRFNTTGGNKPCDYMYRFEGMGKRNENDSDAGKSANQTMINNIMTSNTNYFNQASQKFQYEMTNLQSSISMIQSMMRELFDIGKQPI